MVTLVRGSFGRVARIFSPLLPLDSRAFWTKRSPTRARHRCPQPPLLFLPFPLPASTILIPLFHAFPDPLLRLGMTAPAPGGPNDCVFSYPAAPLGWLRSRRRPCRVCAMEVVVAPWLLPTPVLGNRLQERWHQEKCLVCDDSIHYTVRFLSALRLWRKRGHTRVRHRCPQPPIRSSPSPLGKRKLAILIFMSSIVTITGHGQREVTHGRDIAVHSLRLFHLPSPPLPLSLFSVDTHFFGPHQLIH